MIYKKSEDAVSPVIGVMLLLVVTIVIAAVVAVFASGVGTEIEPAPTTVLTITDIHDGGLSVADSWDMSEEFWMSEDVDENDETIYTLGGKTIKMDDNGRYVTVNGEYIFAEDTVYGGDDISSPNEGWEDWLRQYAVNWGGMQDVTVTINSISGDTLDLKKLSVKVYNSEGGLVAEKHQNSLSGTIEPGDSKTIILDELIDTENGELNVVIPNEKVEVSVLYGEHSLVSKELKVTGE